jgi:hypothetical protein
MKSTKAYISRLLFLAAVPLLSVLSLLGAEPLVLEPNDPLGGTFIGPGYIRTLGCEFTVGTSPLLVVSLGVRDWAGTGLVNSHDVGLWDESMNLLAETMVSPGSGVNGFRYIDLTTPVLLSPNEHYILGAAYISYDEDKIGESRTYEGVHPVYNPAITFDAVRFGDSMSGLSFPIYTDQDTDLGMFGPSLEFELVPEPSTWVLVALGSCLIFIRRNTRS